MPSLTLFLALVLLLLSVSVQSAILGRNRSSGSSKQRSFFFRNQSGRRVDVLWVNVFKTPNDFVSQNEGEGYPYGGDTSVLSYIGHTFEIREMPSKKTKSCLNEECRKARFTVNDQENQEITIDKNFKVIHKDDRQRAYETAEKLFQKCKYQVDEEDLSPLEAIDAMTECMEVKVNETLAEKEEEAKFQSDLRHKMAADLIPFACGDVNFTETKEVTNTSWSYNDPVSMKTATLNINRIHERPTSAIFKIDNFASAEYCDAIRIYEENNRVPFTAISEGTAQGSKLFQLASTMYALARESLKWDDMDFAHMHKAGVPLFQVMKDGVGLDLPKLKCVGDEETAMAAAEKGQCRLAGARPLAADTRKILVETPTQLAQTFLFCDEPTSLGGIHFPYAGVHIQPQVGRLVVVISRMPTENEMDGYLEEYHLCPNHHTYVHTFLDTTD
jgi:hypothetical protein